MAVADALSLAGSIVNDPLKADLVSLFSGLDDSGPTLTLGSRILTAGEVELVVGDFVTLGVFPFRPSVGFDCGQSLESKLKVKIPHLADRSISLSPGVHILCAGTPSCNQLDYIEYEDDVVITFRPEFDKLMPWNLFHSFAGAYSGWAQAAEFLDRNETAFCLGQEVELDINEQVMQLWSVKHASKPRVCPIHWSEPWPSQKHVGVHGSVADWTTANLIRVQSNLCFTMSPPCQSWSKGGKHLGLGDLNGWAFMDAIQLACVLQPVCITAECADEIIEHDHFRFVDLLFRSLGYKKVWTQVTPLHHMANHFRTRWLSAWRRSDVEAVFVGFTFPLRHSPRCPWDDPSNHFRTPQVWRPQLCLSNSERATYNNPNLLPRHGRTWNSDDPTAKDQVLWERVPPTDQPLPTLCATYSSQHLLAPSHVQTRGLFTFLRRTADGFEFFDPGLFCSLFGTQSLVVLPTKVSEAFRVVGNAISVPQALLSLGVVMHAVGQLSIDPLHLVRKSWVSRYQSHNAVMFEHHGFVHLCKASEVHEWISIDQCSKVLAGQEFSCEGSFSENEFCIHVSAETPAIDFLLQHFRGPTELVRQIYFRADDVKSCMNMPINFFANQAHEWHIVVASVTLGRCLFSRLRPTEVIEISSTLPFVPQQTIHIHPRVDFDTISRSHWFLKLSDFCKGLSGCNGGSSATLVIVQSDIGFHFQCWDSLDNIQNMANVIQSQIGGYKFTSSGDHTGGNHCTHLVIPLDVTQCRVIYIRETGEFHPVRVDLSCLQNLNFMRAGSGLTMCGASQIEDWPADRVLSLSETSHIFAGGHHQVNGPPPRLAQGADFNQRAEFMCNTNGWLATDEMLVITQTIQWSQRTHHFAPPVLWDPTKPDFEDDGTEVHIFNNSITIIPILLRDHWAACEVHRQGDRATVIMLQVPQELVTRATFIMARMLDIGPHRIEVRTELTNYTPHLCGWTLLQRWFEALQLIDEIPDVSRQYPLPDQYIQTIEMCLQCSIEDWTSNGMSHQLGYLAVRLRKNFLWFRARRQSIGQPVQQPSLVVGIPEPPHRAIILASPATPTLQERIAARLLVYHSFPGWAVSDEIDYTLEILRFQDPNTLFCPPAQWDQQIGQLIFLNGFQPTYHSHRHVIWFVATQNHWIVIEWCIYDAFSQLVLGSKHSVLPSGTMGPTDWGSSFSSTDSSRHTTRTGMSFGLLRPRIIGLSLSGASTMHSANWYSQFLLCGDTWCIS